MALLSRMRRAARTSSVAGRTHMATIATARPLRTLGRNSTCWRRATPARSRAVWGAGRYVGREGGDSQGGGDPIHIGIGTSLPVQRWKVGVSVYLPRLCRLAQGSYSWCLCVCLVPGSQKCALCLCAVAAPDFKVRLCALALCIVCIYKRSCDFWNTHIFLCSDRHNRISFVRFI